MDRIPAFLRTPNFDSNAEWVSRVSKNAERVSAEIEAERKEEHARYLRDSFAGKCGDWLQWPTDEQKEKALDEIYHALRLPPEDALLRVELIMSALIVKAADGHVAACIRNGKL